jgi:hypothetical protein
MIHRRQEDSVDSTSFFRHIHCRKVRIAERFRARVRSCIATGVAVVLLAAIVDAAIRPIPDAVNVKVFVRLENGSPENGSTSNFGACSPAASTAVRFPSHADPAPSATASVITAVPIHKFRFMADLALLDDDPPRSGRFGGLYIVFPAYTLSKTCVLQEGCGLAPAGASRPAQAWY